MSKLLFSQKDFLKFIDHFGFKYLRHESSHYTYQAIIKGKTYQVQVDHSYSDYSGWLLDSMITQTGIPKKLFWKFRLSGKLPE